MTMVFVTGNVGVMPGTEHAEHVRKCFETADKTEKGTTIYVLDSLFAHEAHKEDMIVYLERLPGRKVLVTRGGSFAGGASWEERRLSGWADTCRYRKVEHWGMKFQLSPDVNNMRFDDGLIIHCEKDRQDDRHHVNVGWNEWTDRFGPGGLNSLYSLGILAGQYKLGLLAPEPN